MVRHLRRLSLLASAVAVLLIAACGLISGNGNSVQALYQQFVVVPTGVGVLAQTGAGLETACVLKPGSPLQKDIDTSLVSIVAGLNAGNASIQAGNTSAASAGLQTVLAAVAALQAKMAGIPVPARVAVQLSERPRTMARATAASGGVMVWGPQVIQLIIAMMPAIIEGATQISPIVKGWIDAIRGGNDQPQLTAADVGRANTSMNTGFAVWTNNAATVCP